jgi:hypothetical protein
LAFPRQVISSTWHFLDRSFHQLGISSTGHFINLAFPRQVISSTWHFLDRTFHQLGISLTGLFINWTFHQLDISLTGHIKCTFHLMEISLTLITKPSQLLQAHKVSILFDQILPFGKMSSLSKCRGAMPKFAFAESTFYWFPFSELQKRFLI